MRRAQCDGAERWGGKVASLSCLHLLAYFGHDIIYQTITEMTMNARNIEKLGQGSSEQCYSVTKVVRPVCVEVKPTAATRFMSKCARSQSPNADHGKRPRYDEHSKSLWSLWDGAG
jgi:hypothetical protein